SLLLVLLFPVLLVIAPPISAFYPLSLHDALPIYCGWWATGVTITCGSHDCTVSCSRADRLKIDFWDTFSSSDIAFGITKCLGQRCVPEFFRNEYGFYTGSRT